jgi:flagellar hook-associated protein 1 FlgK
VSLVSLLSIARSALLIQQRAMTVTAHNVANAQTPGYSRQRLDLMTADPERTPFGEMGRGVTASGVTRVRDTLLDLAYRSDNSQLGNAQTRLDVMGGVESAVSEPSDQGVSAAFDGLLTAFGDLANDPANGPLREQVRAAGQRFVNEVHRVNDALGQATSQAMARLQSQVTDVDRIAAQVAQLNAQIAQTQGADVPDLQDRRDQLVDQLASYGAVKTSIEADGSMNISLGDHQLVQGAQSHDLQVVAIPTGGWGVGPAGGATVVSTGGGSLGALSDLLTTTLPGMQSQLDQFVTSAVNEVNTLHAAGFTLSGGTGVNFFDQPSPNAGALALGASIQASTDNIAAAATAAPGDGNNALAIAALGSKAIVALGGKTLRDYYNQFATGVGIASQNADQDVTTQQTLLARDDARRQSVSGVSVDEEMVNLIGQQQAYSAAARLVTVADQMAQTLLAMWPTTA